MTAALIVLSAALVILAVVLAVVIQGCAAEREQWIEERRALTDRVIARHMGEVIALDRNAKSMPVERDEAPLIEGLM